MTDLSSFSTASVALRQVRLAMTYLWPQSLRHGSLFFRILVAFGTSALGTALIILYCDFYFSFVSFPTPRRSVLNGDI